MQRCWGSGSPGRADHSVISLSSVEEGLVRARRHLHGQGHDLLGPEQENAFA